MKTLSFQISDEAYNLLLKIDREGGYAEYRDTEFKTLEDFKQSDLFLLNNRTEKWFLSRNFDGTFVHIPELLRYDLIQFDGMSWHDTYILTVLGKTVLNNVENV